MRQRVILICEECLARNYQTIKKVTNERLVLKKFCVHCNKHTTHKETK